MFGSDLRTQLELLGLSQADFARLVSVTPRAVSLWLRGDREIPGSVEAYLRLLASLPAGARMAELSRLQGRDTPVKEGMYGITFYFGGNVGIGVMVFEGGRIYGADSGTAKYDGEYLYNELSGAVEIRLKVTFPPNVPAIFGVTNPYEWSIDVVTALNPRLEAGEIIVRTSLGQQMPARYQFLRALPEAA